jgi:hypothetical protein
MLTRWFEAADREVDRFNAWLERLGAPGLALLVLMACSAWSAVDLVLFVIR